MKKDILLFVGLPFVFLLFGELNVLFGNLFYGLWILTINLLAITLIVIFSSLELKNKDVLQGIALLIILRLTNISIPQFTESYMIRYLLIYGIMIIPIYYIVRNNVRFFYLVAILIIAAVLDVSYYEMLNPIPLEFIYISGGFATAHIIIYMTITLLISDTMYHTKYVSNMLNMISNSLLPVFMTITIFKIISII